ncbi:hypothetical protein [Alteromonas macleodii]|uniref:hypothetical protein n=1 Tax=Alteromonas macleodii TaxID=28108 RepID=UPI000A571BEF|nr:hypothetical protein [Alteromonas macleodii]
MSLVSGVWVKVDDTFLTIQPAEDKDLDAVLDFNDIDNDNDGLVDEDYTPTIIKW